MKYNLITNYYVDKNAERAAEIDYCLLENVVRGMFRNIVIVATIHDFLRIRNNLGILDGRILPFFTYRRLTFNNYFYEISKMFKGNDNINIISNSDIIIPKKTLIQTPLYLVTDKTCLSLSRWDITNKEDYENNSVLYNHCDSQDTWIFRGSIPQIEGADFTLGKAGCDNVIAHLLEQAGYHVINPSKTLKTYHFHLSGIRNYTDAAGNVIEKVLPPPYKLIQPTE